MSVIIGCVREECVWMATDTQRTWGNTVTHAKSEFASNILWMPNGVMVGIAGNQAVKHAVAVHEEWFENLSNQPLTKKYIVEEIIPSLYKAMEEINEIDERSAKSGRTLFNGMILLAQQNRLYCIDSDFAVVSIADYCLIGHGSEYGVPRMEQYDTTLSDDETMELLEKALKDAEKFSKMTSAPFQMSDTLSRKIVEIGEHKK